MNLKGFGDEDSESEKKMKLRKKIFIVIPKKKINEFAKKIIDL